MPAPREKPLCLTSERRGGLVTTSHRDPALQHATLHREPMIREVMN